tara:strand:+ start:2706 stop:3245 length:540 start_codon:yes stop_codon:yes gene_type:complete
MALQSSGAISLGNVQTQYSDGGSASMSEFYRGGSRVVASVTTTEQVATPYTYYTTTYSTQNESAYGNNDMHYWHTSRNVSWLEWGNVYKNYVYGNTTSVTHSDGWTYSKGATQVTQASSWNGVAGTLYFSTINRTRQVATQNGPYTGYTYSNVTTTTQKNTSVPSSGTISLNQFYGGTN